MTDLRTCRESRDVFEPALYGWNFVLDHCDGFSDLEVDTIMIPGDLYSEMGLCLYEFSDIVFAGLRYLTMDYEAWRGWSEATENTKVSMLKFRSWSY